MGMEAGLCMCIRLALGMAFQISPELLSETFNWEQSSLPVLHVCVLSSQHSEEPVVFFQSDCPLYAHVTVKLQCVVHTSTIAEWAPSLIVPLALQLDSEEQHGVKGLGLLGIGPQLVLTLDIETLEVCGCMRACVCACVHACVLYSICSCTYRIPECEHLNLLSCQYTFAQDIRTCLTVVTNCCSLNIYVCTLDWGFLLTMHDIISHAPDRLTLNYSISYVCWQIFSHVVLTAFVQFWCGNACLPIVCLSCTSYLLS